MTSSEDPHDKGANELPAAPDGDQIHVDKIENAGAVAIGRGAMATAVYQGLTIEQVAALVVELKRQDQPQVWDGRNPYLGLNAFQEEDAALFFGREEVVDDLLQRVQKTRFIVIAGPSGSGKSSVARAGLFHALRQGQRVPGSTKWLLAAMSPGGNPIARLATAVARTAGTPDAGDYIRREGIDNPSALHQQVEALARMSDDSRQRFILLVDQFEEIFTQTKNDQEREAFINLLTTAIAVENGRIVIILSLRSDFISHCARYPGLRAQINKTNQFQLVGSLNSRDLARAITLPALAVGAQIEPALVKQIIDHMKGEPGALPLMSFALRDLFEAQKTAKGRPLHLTLQEYLDRGGIDSALQRHADLILESFSPDQQDLAKNIFSRLIEVGQGRLDTRRTAVFAELVPGGENEEAVAAVVYKLAQEDVRLLITAGAHEEPADSLDTKELATVTIAHEKLIDAWPWLRRLVDENRETIALQNQINSDALAWDRTEDAGFLYRGGRLLQVEEQYDSLKPHFNSLSQRFIETSLAQRAKERRQSRRNGAIFVGLLALLLTGALFAAALFNRQATDNKNIAATAQAESTRAFLSEQSAAEERDTALSRQLAAQAQLHLDGPLDSALLLAVQATKTKLTMEGRHSLLQALTRNSHPAIFLHGHNGNVNNMALSSDGRIAATGGCAQAAGSNICAHGEIKLWDLQTMQPLGSPLTGHNGAIRSLAFSPDGRILASGGEDTQLLLWDLTQQQPVGSPLMGNTELVNSLTFSPDGELLAASSRTRLFLWDMATKQPQELFAETRTNMITSVAFSPDGESVATGGFSGQIHFWEVRTGQPIQAIFLDPAVPDTFDHAIWQIAFSPDGQTIAAGGCATIGAKGCGEGEIRLFDIATGQEKSEPIITENGVYGIAFSPDGQFFASASCAELLQPWCFLGEMSLRTIGSNGLNSTPSYDLLANDGWVSHVAFTPDSKALLSAGENGFIALWDIVNRPLKHGLDWDSGVSSVTSLAFSPNGSLLALGDDTGNITIWDFTQDRFLDEFPAQHTRAVRSLAFSPDGRLLMSGADDGLVLLWDAAGGEPIERLLQEEETEIAAVAFSPDGRIQAAGSCAAYADSGFCSAGLLHIWQDRSSRQTIAAHEGLIRGIAFSPDGQTLASAGSDGAVIFWDGASGQQVGETLQAADHPINSIAYSPDGTLLATAGEDGLIKFWDAATHRHVGQPLIGHFNPIAAIAFSPDSLTLASGSCAAGRWSRTCSIGETYLWDVASQAMIGQNLNPEARVSSISFSPDGLILAAGSDFGHVDLLQVGLAAWQERACALANRDLSQAEWERHVGLNIPYQKTC